MASISSDFPLYPQIDPSTAAVLGTNNLEEAIALLNERTKPLSFPNNQYQLYVSTTGNDITGEGSQSSPYQSIEKCISDFNSDYRLLGNDLWILVRGQVNVEASINFSNCLAERILVIPDFTVGSRANIELRNRSTISVYNRKSLFFVFINFTSTPDTVERGTNTALSAFDISALSLFDCSFIGFDNYNGILVKNESKLIVDGSLANTIDTNFGEYFLKLVGSSECVFEDQFTILNNPTIPTLIVLEESSELSFRSEIQGFNGDFVGKKFDLKSGSSLFTRNYVSDENDISIGGTSGTAQPGCQFDRIYYVNTTVTNTIATDIEAALGELKGETTALNVNAPGTTVYLDGTNGDDSNDGFSSSTPVQSSSALIAILARYQWSGQTVSLDIKNQSTFLFLFGNILRGVNDLRFTEASTISQPIAFVGVTSIISLRDFTLTGSGSFIFLTCSAIEVSSSLNIDSLNTNTVFNIESCSRFSIIGLNASNVNCDTFVRAKAVTNILLDFGAFTNLTCTNFIRLIGGCDLLTLDNTSNSLTGRVLKLDDNPFLDIKSSNWNVTGTIADLYPTTYVLNDVPYIAQAPSNTIFIDNVNGNDNNDGFTSSIQSTNRLIQILNGYSWNGTVKLNVQNQTAPISFNLASPKGITQFEIEQGSTLTNALVIFGFQGRIIIDFVTVTGLGGIFFIDCQTVTLGAGTEIINVNTASNVFSFTNCNEVNFNTVLLNNVTCKDFLLANNVITLVFKVATYTGVTCDNLINLVGGCSKLLVENGQGNVTGRVLKLDDNPFLELKSNNWGITGTVADLYPSIYSLNGVPYSSFDPTETTLTSTSKNSAIAELDRKIISLAVGTSNAGAIWISGLRGAIGNPTTSLNIEPGEIIFFSPEQWTTRNFAATNLDFPTILESSTMAFLYADKDEFNFTSEVAATENLRDRVYLGLAKTSDNINFESFEPFVITRSPEVLQLLLFGGFANPNQIFPQPNPGTLQLSFPGGTIKAVGRNHFNDPLNPHDFIVPAANPLTWDRIAPDGTVIAAGESNLNFTQYWDGTATGTVPNNDATTLYLYFSPPNSFYLVLGTNFYNNLETDLRLYPSELHVTPEFLKGNSLLLAAILGTANATDSANLSQVVIRGYKVTYA